MNQGKGIDGHETIAALATGTGGAISIIRISGPVAEAVSGRVWRGTRPVADIPARVLSLGQIMASDGIPLDHAFLVRFPAPASYTGESMVELQCHGGPVIAGAVLRGLFAAGARPAAPGEFTRRAFLNGKMDLIQAEAVADLIAAKTEQALRLAHNQLHGLLGTQVNRIVNGVVELLSEVEGTVDFPEECQALKNGAEQEKRFAQILQAVDTLLESSREGYIFRHGARVVIAGPPNVGKSSLLNAMLGHDRAIVTPLPGTTRDTVEESVNIQGIPVCLMDTAGIRETEDMIEKEGIARTLTGIQAAHLVLWVMDGARPLQEQHPGSLAEEAPLYIINKMDLIPACGRRQRDASWPEPVLYTCALSGEGLDRLYHAIAARIWAQSPHDMEVAVNERHTAHLHAVRKYLAAAMQDAGNQQWELCAVPLRGALQELGRITGKTVAPDILDTIFSRFCIGK